MLLIHINDTQTAHSSHAHIPTWCGSLVAVTSTLYLVPRRGGGVAGRDRDAVHPIALTFTKVALLRPVRLSVSDFSMNAANGSLAGARDERLAGDSRCLSPVASTEAGRTRRLGSLPRPLESLALCCVGSPTSLCAGARPRIEDAG